MNIKSFFYRFCPGFLKPLLVRVENSSIGYRLATGVFWTMVGAFISRGLMFLALVVVARFLGKIGYGEFGMLKSTIGMFGIIAGFGLGLTATKHVAEFRQTNPARAGRIICLSNIVAIMSGGLMAACLFFFAPWLAESTINAPHLIKELKIASLTLLLSSITGNQTGALGGFEAFKSIAYINCFVGLFSFPCLIAGAYLGGLTGVVWALVINLIIQWGLNYLALRKELRRNKISLNLDNYRDELPILWKFSIPAVLAGAMTGPANWFCRALLTRQTDGYSQMGDLTAALVFQMIVIFLSGMLSQPLMSMVSNVGSRISNLMSTINILSTWLLGVIFAVPLLCYPEIAQLAFGQEYYSYSFKVTFCLIVLCTTVMTYKTGITRVMVSNNLLWFSFASNALWAIVLVISSIYFVKYGASGIALALVISYSINTLVMFPLYYSKKLIPAGSLLSIQSVSIWFILIGLVLLNVYNVTVLIRSVIIIPSMLIIGFAFYNIAKKSITKNV